MVFFRTNLHCRTAISKWIAISQLQVQKIKQNEFFLYIVYNFAEIRSRNSKVYAVNYSTFCGDTEKKSSYHVKYLRISWTYLDLLYRFGRSISGDDYPNVRLAVAQGTSLWQPVKFRGWSQTSPEGLLLLASAFDNGLADRKSAFKR